MCNMMTAMGVTGVGNSIVCFLDSLPQGLCSNTLPPSRFTVCEAAAESDSETARLAETLGHTEPDWLGGV
jgi:hypothetical protein